MICVNLLSSHHITQICIHTTRLQNLERFSSCLLYAPSTNPHLMASLDSRSLMMRPLVGCTTTFLYKRVCTFDSPPTNKQTNSFKGYLTEKNSFSFVFIEPTGDYSSSMTQEGPVVRPPRSGDFTDTQEFRSNRRKRGVLRRRKRKVDFPG